MLNQDDLASFRLKVRSDVIGTWELASTTYNHFYCQVKIVVSGCGFKSAISKSKKTLWGLKVDEDSVAIQHTCVWLLPPDLSKLTQQAFYWLKRETTPATGAAKAYHESQSRVFTTEAPQFVGTGEGTDNLDFLADLSALKVIDPDSVSQAIPPGDKPVPKSTSLLLEQLRYESVPYAHCAWCPETPKTRGMLEESTTMIFIMWCYNSHVVLHLQCFRPLWAWSCS